MSCGRIGICRADRRWVRWAVVRAPALAALTLMAALALTPAWALAGARVRVVDTNVSVADEPDVVCTADGEILVVYRHSGEQALKLARVTPSTATLSALCTQVGAGEDPSAQITSLGMLSVSHSGFSGGLGYTLDGGDVFGLSTVAISGTSDGKQPVHVLDSLDRPFVAYRGLLYVPKLARFDIPSGTWMTETIPGSIIYPTVPGHLIAIAMDGQDRPAVVYHDQYGNLDLATRAPGGWTLRSHALQQPPTMTGGVALGFDTTDAACVAVNAAGRLSILRFGTLGVTTIYSPEPPVPATIGPHSMKLDDHNGISLAYYDPRTRAVSVATRTAVWTTTTIEHKLTAGAPALGLDSLHRWAIAYVDATTWQLKVSAEAWWDFARPDFDCDGHVDGADAEHLTACMTGPTVMQSDASCLDADLDGDRDVDLSDFGIYQACYSGPSQPANPQCAD